MKPLNMKDTLSTELSNLGVTGSDKLNVTKHFQNESDEKEKREKSVDYLKDGVSLKDIYVLVKNKKFSNNKIKSEIKKLLKDPEELVDFLKSFIKPKEEPKEATASGGGVGSYEAPLFGEMDDEDVTKVETKEATGASSSGSYETPSFLAKSMSKKNWRGRSKTQLPGGKFVQVKKKCKRFPYCNQGDINALNLFENDTIKNTINKISEKYGIHEDHIRDIISYEFQKYTK